MAGAAATAAMPKSLRGSPGAEARPFGLGLVIYCCGLRQKANKQRNLAQDLSDPLTFLEHAHGLDAGGIQMPLGVRDGEYARRLRTRAEQHGMFVEAIVGPPLKPDGAERFEAEVRTAAAAGVRAVRTVIIPGRRYEAFDSLEKFRQAEARGQKALQTAAPIVEKHRVRLAVENHKDHLAAQRVELLRRISSPWVGACVDTGNNFALLEDPVEVVRTLAPWAFSVHLKDQAVRECDEGFLYADVPLGQGFLDLKQMVALLRQARPEVSFSLELITRDPLTVPCLTEAYWAAMGDLAARDLARTLRTVRRHQADALPQVGSLGLEEQIAREEANVKASLAYSREHLGL